jgi:phosphomannomutase/phosphoglucomutase
MPGATIIYDVKSTRLLGPWIEKHGGVPMIWKTGHSFIKARLKETGAPLAGEMSGHTFFKERWYGFDDALYTPARACWRSCRARRTPTPCCAPCPMRPRRRN